MLGKNGVSAEATMNSLVERESSSGFSESSAVGVEFSNVNDNSTESSSTRGKTHGFEGAFALVEDGINHACQRLTSKLSNIHIASRRDAEEVARRSDVVAWLNNMFDALDLPDEPSEEDLRALLSDGSILCKLMNKLNPGSIPKIIYPGLDNSQGDEHSAYQRFENVRNFLVAIDDLQLPTFEASDLEEGSMVTIVDCLLSLKEYYDLKHGWKQGTELGMQSATKSTVKGFFPGKPLNNTLKSGNQPRKRWIQPDLDNGTASDNQLVDESLGLNGQKIGKLPQKPVDCRDSSPAWIQHIGKKFHDVLQVKEMHYPDIQEVESSGILKHLDNAPSQSLLSLVSAILGDKQNDEVPSLVEFTLRKVMEEFEHRLLCQRDHIKKLKHALREAVVREDKIVSRANALEALAAGSAEEIKLLTEQMQKIKMEKMLVEDEKKAKEKDMMQLEKQREASEISVQTLKEQLAMMSKTSQEHVQELELKNREAILELQKELKEMEGLLAQSKRKNDEQEAISSMELQRLKHRDSCYQKLLSEQVQALQEVRSVSQLTKEDVLKIQKHLQSEIKVLEDRLMGLANAATNYHKVLEENRQLYNEVQDLKGNIRVYCRVRPFLTGQSAKQTTIEYIGENGELLLVNPSKQGKDTQRMFNFNKVFGPFATQEEVFLDTRPLIRSVLDGYNVCIFAYGQTGSGKTYTMSGPNSSCEEFWGVNYRALCDLFQISQKRRDTFRYYIGVQMIEIYNEQVRDLLTSDGSNKRLGIRSISQPNGLNVPDASLWPVESTSDVLDLMEIGQRNRAVGATALNERSSRSHSVLTVHVQGIDVSSGAILRGCLHLIDLAGSERVDKSEAIGDRLREAQHINKSLSALGDVIYALANKMVHVPYRNSKLTQILQDSLGGQAKTLMFVQLNPDVESYSETISTLKFAERVSGVELGAARSNKEGKDIRDLKEQIVLLKYVVAKKDAEIERLQMLKERRSPAQSQKAMQGRQGHCTRRVATGRPGNSEHHHQILTGQASKQLSQRSFQDNSSQDCESTSTADSDDMSGKYSAPGKLQCGMSSKRCDSKAGLSTSLVSHLRTKAQNDLFMEKDDVPKECPDMVRSSSDSSLLVIASQEEAASTCNVKMEKMDMEGISLVDNHKRVSDADNISEYNDKNSDMGSQEPSMQVSELMQYKGHMMPFNRDIENVPADVELLGLNDGDLEERLSEISDGDLSMGTETDGSISSVVELTLFPEKKESGNLNSENNKRSTPSQIPRPPIKSQHQTLARPHTKAVKHSSGTRGIDRPSPRQPSGQSSNSTGVVDPLQRRRSQKPPTVSPQTPNSQDSMTDSHQRSSSLQQSGSKQLSGYSPSSKRSQ